MKLETGQNLTFLPILSELPLWRNSFPISLSSYPSIFLTLFGYGNCIEPFLLKRSPVLNFLFFFLFLTAGGDAGEAHSFTAPVGAKKLKPRPTGVPPA